MVYFDDVYNHISETDQIKGKIMAVYNRHKTNMSEFKQKLKEELYEFFNENRSLKDTDEDILKKAEEWCIMAEYLDGY